MIAILLGLAGKAIGLIPGVGSVIGLVPAGGWKIIGLVAAIGFGVVYVDRHATHRERAKCAAASAIAERDHARLERDSLAERAERATATAATLEKEKGEADERAVNLGLELDKASKLADEERERANKAEAGKCPACPKTTGPCRLDDDAIRRLRGGGRSPGNN